MSLSIAYKYGLEEIKPCFQYSNTEPDNGVGIYYPCLNGWERCSVSEFRFEVDVLK